MANHHQPWPKGTLEHRQGNVVRLSIPFTWNLRDAHQRARFLATQGYQVLAGGPAVNLMPEYLAGVAGVGTLSLSKGWPGAVQRHNPDATFTSRGCLRKCVFCAVPKAEGAFRELAQWPVAPIVCDNNFLASSRVHFDNAVDRLKKVRKRGIDFNQGLDARLMTPYRAGRLAELQCLARLAFDHLSVESAFMDAFKMLRDAGFPKSRIRCYVLIGYDDTPEDALYRLELVHSLGIRPFPGRYQPLDTLVKNSHVAPGWTHQELRRYQHYWSRLHYHSQIPFKDFRLGYRNQTRRHAATDAPPPPVGATLRGRPLPTHQGGSNP